MSDPITRHGLVELAKAAQDGCEQALERLLAQVHVHVVRSCRVWLTGAGAAVADEVAQETLVRIAARIDECRADADAMLLAWCRAIARNAAIDCLREHKAEWEVRTLTGGVALDVSGDAAPENTAAVRTLLDALDEVLESESGPAQTLLWLRLVQRDTWAEAGETLGITAGAAKRRFQRTMVRLRKAVSRTLALRPPREREQALRWLARGPGRAESPPDEGSPARRDTQ